MKIVDWNIEELTGYKPISTFYTDFSIADNCMRFEKTAIKDTYSRAFNSWKNDYKMLTELVMVLNWKISEHFDSGNGFDEIYTELYYEADEYAKENLKGEELEYYYKTTD